MKTVIVNKIILMTIIALSVEGKISININVDDKNNVKATHTGFDTNVISDQDIKLFKIETNNLKKAVKSYTGRTPDDVYLKSPTPWGDLFKDYNWEQVIRDLTVKSVNVKGISTSPVIVMTQNFENFSNHSIKVNAGISQTVTNTLTTSWTRSSDFTISQELEYGVEVFKGTTGFSFTSSWGQSEEKSESITMGSTSAVEIELKPGQTATTVLSANKGTLEVEVVYQARLRGKVAANFKKIHNGHHFWGFPIDNVMKSAGLENPIIVTETIRMTFYIDGSLKVYDKASGARMLVVNL